MTSASPASVVFTPVSIGGLRLRNRIVRSAAFEGMSEGGTPSPALVRYHASVARGGAAMTTVAYASVSPAGRTYGHQLLMTLPGIEAGLRRLTDAVHGEGAAACIQIGHCGYFAEPALTGLPTIGPSVVFNHYGLSLPRAMTERDIDEVADDFARSAARARESGFDAVELHAGHGYLVSQFLSPYTNRRDDRWGGGIEGRARFAVEVLRRVREAVGGSYPVIAKLNLTDGFEGGMDLDDAVEAARILEREGIDALVLSGGFVSRTPMYIMRGEVPYEDMAAGQTRWAKKVGLLVMGRILVRSWPFEEAYFLRDARRVREAVRIPLALVGGMRTLEVMESVVGEGFEMVAMARPLIMEPDLPARMLRGETRASRCVPCNRCIAFMDHGHMRCPVIEEGAGPRGTPREHGGRAT